jgi:uncharacterized protein (TIGR03437 family)
VKAGHRRRRSPCFGSQQFLLLALWTLQPAQCLHAQINVNLTSVVFNYDLGEPLPPAETLSVTAPSATQFSAIASSAGGTAWFTITPSGNLTTNQTISVQVTSDIQNLAVGTYYGSIVLTSSSSPVTQSVAVQLNVAPAPVAANLAVSPSTLSFSNTNPQSLTISSATAGLTAIPFYLSVPAVAGRGSAWIDVVGPQGLINGAAGGYILTTPVTLTVQPATGALSTTGSIVVSPAICCGASVTIPVAYLAQLPLAVTASPASLSFTEQVGSAAPLPQLIQLSAQGGAALPFTVQAGTGITVTPASSTTPATLIVSLTAASAATAGFIGLLGDVNITPTGGSNLSIPVELTVIPAQGISVGASSLNFAYQIGGTLPNPQTIQLSLPGGGVASFSTATKPAGSWLSVSPSQASTPSALTVSVSPSKLVAGTYTGVVSIYPNSGPEIDVQITLTVSAASASISAAPSSINTSWQSGSPSLSAPIQITTSGSTSLAFSAVASSAGNWLSVTPSSGVAPTTITASLSTTGLSAGLTYTGTITVVPSGGAPIIIPVTMLVVAGPTISVSPASLAFAYQTGGAIPAAQSVEVSGLAGSQSFDVALVAASLSQPNAWLSVTPLTGTTPATLAVSVSPSGLAAGTYTLSILVTPLNPPSGVPRPQTIPVTLTVTPVSTVTVSPGSVNLSLPSGSGAVQQSLQIAGVGGSAVPFTASAVSTGNWLSVMPASGTSPATVTVSISPANLTPATYTGAVTVTPMAAPALTVAVLLTVTYPSVSVSQASLTFAYQTGGAIPAAQIIQVNSVGSAQEFTAQILNASSGNWLSITPLSGVTPATLSVSVSPSAFAAGTYMAVISLAAAGGTVAQTIPVTLTIAVPTLALPSITAVVNAASFSSGAVAQGEIVTIGGTNLAPATPFGLTFNSSGKVATTLGGVSVYFNGYLSPLVYVSESQINCVVPYEVAAIANPWVEVQYSGATSNAYSLKIAAAAPSIFTQNGSGSGPGAILDGSGAVNGIANPAAPGSTVVIYLTGEGQTSPGGVTGQVTTVNSSASGPLTPQPVLPLTVAMGGQAAVVSFYGEAPGLVSGVLQINAIVPPGLTSGEASLSVSIGGVESQPGVTIVVGSS